jgi:acetyl esterase/lipase
LNPKPTIKKIPLADQMKSIFKFLTYLSAVLGMILFLRPKDSSINTLLWIPKLIAGAISPILGFAGGLGALLGLVRKDWKLTGAGLLGAGLAARFIADIPASSDQFTRAFGPDWQALVPQDLRHSTAAGRSRLSSIPDGRFEIQRDLVIGRKPKSGKPFLVDLWQPVPGTTRSGLGIIYAHGSGWRVGDKDMLTRTFFRKLVGNGHVVVDIAYSLWPEADVPTMVSEVNQAILWLKENADKFKLNSERIVLVGGSAGAHLALLAAYNPGQPKFQSDSVMGDTSVRGVVAFYPAVDFSAMYSQIRQDIPANHRPIDKLANALLNRIFELPKGKPTLTEENGASLDNYLVDILGGTPDEIPEVYVLCSPIEHINKACPPTLLIQGSDDVFGLTPQVRRFYQSLQEAGVPVIYLEYPHTEHGFDLVLPQLSPAARAATREVERFLGLLV